MPRRPLSSARRTNPAARMMMLRQWHTYIGAFIAPSVLFFAFTGALQLFNLHESREGYTAPALLQQLGSIHKDQVLKAAHADAPEVGDHPDAHAEHHHGPAVSPAAQMRIWALKWVFAIVAVGLIVSTILGLWMAFTQSRRRGVAVFVVGAAIPLLLLFL